MSHRKKAVRARAGAETYHASPSGPAISTKVGRTSKGRIAAIACTREGVRHVCGEGKGQAVSTAVSSALKQLANKLVRRPKSLVRAYAKKRLPAVEAKVAAKKAAEEAEALRRESAKMRYVMARRYGGYAKKRRARRARRGYARRRR